MRNKIYQWVWTDIHAAVFFQQQKIEIQES